MLQVVLDGVVGVHAQEAASLCETRIAQLKLSHVNLLNLGRIDDRLLAHFDGLATADNHAQRLLDVWRLEIPLEASCSRSRFKR